MDLQTARAIVKSINRQAKKSRFFYNSRKFGVDWVTWHACYPQIAKQFDFCAEIVAGKKGRFLPRYFA